jgi:Tol biopolymer transport system component
MTLAPKTCSCGTRRTSWRGGSCSGSAPAGARHLTLTAAAVAAVALAVPAVGHGAIALQRQPGSPKAIHLANDDGTGLHRLPAAGGNPVISPDGARVAFQEVRRDGDNRLRILTIADGTIVPSPQVCRLPPVWSPDSTRLLCTTETAAPDGTVTGDGLALVDAATGAAQTLIAAPGNGVESATWSPDGTRIAYANGRFTRIRRDVFVADPAAMGGAARILRNATTPVWGPTSIAATRLTSRRVRIGGQPTTAIHSQIWLVDPSGRGARRLTSYRAPSFLVTGPFAAFWTPDGSRLVGTVGGTDYAELITVDARPGRLRARRPASERVTAPVAVSADGRRVLFLDGPPGGGASRLRVVGVTGGHDRILVRGVRTATASAGWQP